MDINELMRAMELFASVDSELQIQTLQTFLFVAQKGTCSQKDVELGLELSNAGASRNISYWTHRRFDRKPGKNFILREEDDFDRRFKKLTLTTDGRAFYQKLLKGQTRGKTTQD